MKTFIFFIFLTTALVSVFAGVTIGIATALTKVFADLTIGHALIASSIVTFIAADWMRRLVSFFLGCGQFVDDYQGEESLEAEKGVETVYIMPNYDFFRGKPKRQKRQPPK